MNLMCLSNGHQVGVVGSLKPFESSMDEHIVDNEISQPIKGNSYTNPQSHVGGGPSGDETVRAGNSENDKKGIVFFKETRAVRVVVLVEVPHGTMHEAFVSQPGNTFHGNEGAKDSAKG